MLFLCAWHEIQRGAKHVCMCVCVLIKASCCSAGIGLFDVGHSVVTKSGMHARPLAAGHAGPSRHPGGHVCERADRPVRKGKQAV